jgi:thymidylate synthase (FAD)
MKVRLIDYTGIGQNDPADFAAKRLIYAKSTRLEQGEDTEAIINAMGSEQVFTNLIEIANTIRSSWEFVHYTWEITGVTRAFTHQFVRSRHLSFAQQAMRVADMSYFDTLTPSSIAANPKLQDRWDRCMAMISTTYRAFLDEGIPAQDARGVLPTNVLTNIIAGANLRAFADLVGKRLNLRVQDEYQSVATAMTARVLDVHPWASHFLFPPRNDTRTIDAILKRALDGRPPVEIPEVNNALKELDRLKGTWG